MSTSLRKLLMATSAAALSSSFGRRTTGPGSAMLKSHGFSAVLFRYAASW